MGLENKMTPPVSNTNDKSILDKLHQPAMVLLVLLGLVLRVRAFLTGRSLWVDEAMLAINIVRRSFAGLTQQPMEYGQSAPIGFVFSAKAITLLFGDSEYALRLFSLLAGCAALILMVFISRQVLNMPGSLMALAIFSVGPYLVYYSSEAKQYMGDVIAGLIFLFLFLKQTSTLPSKRDFVLLGIGGALTLWLSHPSVFIAAGVGLALFVHYWTLRDRSRLLQLSLCGFLWSISLAILYFVNLRHLAASELLLNYWQGGFMALPPWSNLDWFANIWQSFLRDPLGMNANPFIVLAFFITGIIFVLRRHRSLGVAIILSLTFMLIASALHKYPLLGRMLLFIVPLFAIVTAAGVDGLASLFGNRYLVTGIKILAIGYLLAGPFGTSLEGFIRPKYNEHMKPTLEYLKAYVKDDDLIYVYYNAGPAFQFYAPKYGLDTINYIIGEDHSADPVAYYEEIDQFVGNKRVWFIFSHVYEKGNFNDRDFILEHLKQTGKRTRVYIVPGTSVYLYLYDLK